MKLLLTSTDLIMKVLATDGAPAEHGVECRLWEGTTDKGIPVSCLIARIAVNSDHSQKEFERELKKRPAPITLADVMPRKLVNATSAAAFLTELKKGPKKATPIDVYEEEDD